MRPVERQIVGIEMHQRHAQQTVFELGKAFPDQAVYRLRRQLEFLARNLPGQRDRQPLEWIEIPLRRRHGRPDPVHQFTQCRRQGSKLGFGLLAPFGQTPRLSLADRLVQLVRRVTLLDHRHEFGFGRRRCVVDL